MSLDLAASSAHRFASMVRSRSEGVLPAAGRSSDSVTQRGRRRPLSADSSERSRSWNELGSTCSPSKALGLFSKKMVDGASMKEVLAPSSQSPSPVRGLRRPAAAWADEGDGAKKALEPVAELRGLAVEHRPALRRLRRACSSDPVQAGRGECDMSLKPHTSHLGIDGKANWVRDKASDGIPWRQIPCHDRFGRITTTGCLSKTGRSGRGMTCLSERFSGGRAAKEVLVAAHGESLVLPAASPSAEHSSVTTRSLMNRPSSSEPENLHISGPLHRERRHFKPRDVSPFAYEGFTPTHQRKTQECIGILSAHASSLVGAGALPTHEGRVLCASDSDAKKARTWEFNKQLEQIRETDDSTAEFSSHLLSVMATSQLLSSVLAAGPVLNATKACLASDAPQQLSLRAPQDSATQHTTSKDSIEEAQSKEVCTMSRQSTAEGIPLRRQPTAESILSSPAGSASSTGSIKSERVKPRWR